MRPAEDEESIWEITITLHQCVCVCGSVYDAVLSSDLDKLALGDPLTSTTATHHLQLYVPGKKDPGEEAAEQRERFRRLAC